VGRSFPLWVIRVVGDLDAPPVYFRFAPETGHVNAQQQNAALCH